MGGKEQIEWTTLITNRDFIKLWSTGNQILDPDLNYIGITQKCEISYNQLWIQRKIFSSSRATFSTWGGLTPKGLMECSQEVNDVLPNRFFIFSFTQP